MTVENMNTIADWAKAHMAPSFVASVSDDHTEFIFRLIDCKEAEGASELSGMITTPEDMAAFNHTFQVLTETILDTLKRDPAISAQIRYITQSRISTEEKVRLLNSLMTTDRVQALVWHTQETAGKAWYA